MVQEEGLQLNFGKASKTLIYKSPDSKWEPQRPTRNNDTRLLRDRNPIQTSAQRPSASNLPFFCGWRQSQPSCNDQQHVSCSLQQQFRAVRTCTHAVIRDMSVLHIHTLVHLQACSQSLAVSAAIPLGGDVLCASADCAHNSRTWHSNRVFQSIYKSQLSSIINKAEISAFCSLRYFGLLVVLCSVLFFNILVNTCIWLTNWWPLSCSHWFRALIFTFIFVNRKKI